MLCCFGRAGNIISASRIEDSPTLPNPAPNRSFLVACELIVIVAEEAFLEIEENQCLGTGVALERSPYRERTLQTKFMMQTNQLFWKDKRRGKGGFKDNRKRRKFKQ
jgi:hypothetical protein